MLPLVILAVGGALTYLIIYLAPKPEKQPETEKLIESVRTEPARLLKTKLPLEVDGTVVPLREVDMAAEVSGRIVSKSEQCRAGRFVTEGQILYEIDPRDYKIARRQLQQQLEQTDANINEVKVDVRLTGKLIQIAGESLALLKKEHSRLVELGETGIVSDSQIDSAMRVVLEAQNALLTIEKQKSTMEARLISLSNGWELIEVQIEKADIDLLRATVRSPVSGVVVADLVEAGDFVTRGALLATIEDTRAVEVLCHLRMDQLQWLWRREPERPADTRAAPETPVPTTAPTASVSDDQPPIDNPKSTETAALDDAGDAKSYEIPPMPAEVEFSLRGRKYIWRGKLSRYDGIGLNRKTRTIPIRVIIEDPREVETFDQEGNRIYGELRPPALIREMFVRVRIMVDPGIPLFIVPETALRPGKKIWIVRDGLLKIVLIEVVESLGDKIIIRVAKDELVEGDRIVVSPLSYAINGIAVTELIDDDNDDGN